MCLIEENVDDIWVMEETQSASATKSVSTEGNVDDIWFAEETSAAKFSLDTDENVVDYPDEELSIVMDNQGIRTATTDEIGAEEENIDDYPSDDSIEAFTTSDEETAAAIYFCRCCSHYLPIDELDRNIRIGWNKDNLYNY